MRLFFALVPPPEIRQQLLLSMGGVQLARWQSDDQLHLTVRYVGGVDGPQADLLITEINRLEFSAIDAQLDGAGHFMRRDYVEQLWIGVSPREPLLALHKHIDRICIRAGLEPESRKFVPHITVARLPRSAGPVTDFLSHNGNLTSAKFSFDRLVLMESHLRDAGSQYVSLAEWNMG